VNKLKYLLFFYQHFNYLFYQYILIRETTSALIKSNKNKIALNKKIISDSLPERKKALLNLPIGAVDPGFRDLIYFVGIVPNNLLKTMSWSYYMKRHKQKNKKKSKFKASQSPNLKRKRRKREKAKNKRFLKRTREKIDSDMPLLKEFEIQLAKDQPISFDRSTHTEIVVSYSNKK
jgi:hypothetical protein